MENSDFIVLARRVLKETEHNTGLDAEELARHVGRLQAVLGMALYDLKDAYARLSESTVVAPQGED
jgi:hypothetical protein